MKFSKTISKGLAIGLLFSNISTSFASTLSEDGRYETFEGNNITIDNILEEDKVDVEIEGNTLVNLWKGFSYAGNMWIQGELQYEDIQGDIAVCNFSSKEILFQLSYNDGTNAENSYYSRSVSVMPGKKIKVNVLPNEKFRMIQGRYEHGWNNTEEDIEEFNSSLVVIKGDYLEEDIKHFEGMKSVGQDDVNGHKIEIISSNKNLFDGVNDRIIDVYSMTRHTYENGVLRVYNVIETNYNRCSYSLSLKPNTWYVFSCNYNINLGNYATVTLRNGTYEDIELSTDNDEEISFKFLTNNSGEIDILFYSTIEIEEIGDVSYYNIQLEESNIATDYTPYKSNIKEILLKEPLRSLPNGVKDRIVKRNGQWVIERRLKEVILDGTEEYEIFKSATGTTGFIISSIKTMPSNPYIQEVLCDIIPSGNHIDFTADAILDWSKEYFRISNRATDKTGLYLLMPSSIANTIDEVKDWMSKNNPKVVYMLPEVVYELVTVEPSVILYKETTYISNDSNIPANLKVTVDRTINRATEAIELAKTNPTVANISQARMWSNLLKETIKKDELQNEINSITNIEDLQLEKKTSSANVDVYIKSENMLLMSLSINSITFNDYSGVEDIELNNIVNISINSSLPYQLNSYLLSEIESADKSNRIEKDLLNIKISKDSDYKNFSDINEKLILEDDCDAGNNKSHSIDLKLKGSQAHKADVYKTVIKFEAEQK